MTHSKLLLLFLVLLTNIAHADLRSGVDAAIMQTVSGIPIGSSTEVTFYRRSVVRIMALNERSALIKGNDIHEGLTEQGLWIPRSALVAKSSFKRVAKWTGEKTLDEDCGDYSATYAFSPDGSFVLSVLDQNGKRHATKGHLYHSNDLIWARRPDQPSALFSHHTLFIRPMGNTWCMPSAEE